MNNVGREVLSRSFLSTELLFDPIRLVASKWSTETRSFFAPSRISAFVPDETTKNIAEKTILRTLMLTIRFFILISYL